MKGKMDMKKQYYIPQTEVMSVSTELMRVGGEGSAPPQVGAPAKREEPF